MSTRSPDPMRDLCSRVAAVFGAGEVHLYVHRARGRGIAVEPTNPPSILLPASVTELGPAHQAFAIARAAANVAAGLYAVDKLTPRELEVVLAAAARRASESFGAGLTSEDILDDIGKRLLRALPRRARKDLDELARAYVASAEGDVPAITEAIVASAERLALLVSDDLLATVDVLRRTERELAELSEKALLAHPRVARLARFWVSADADTLRRRMGLTEPAVAAPALAGR